MKWFRFYSEVVDNPKVQTLPATLFKAWVNVMCIANRQKVRGTIPSDPSILAYCLHTNTQRADEIIKKMLKAGLIDDKNGVFWVHDWLEIQPESDQSKDRVKKYRNTKRSEKPSSDANGNGESTVTVTEMKRRVTDDCNGRVTSLDTDIDTDTDKSIINTPPVLSSASTVSDEIAAGLEEAASAGEIPGTTGPPTYDELMSRYDERQSELITHYWEGIATHTRQNGKVAEGVVRKTMAQWDRYPVEIVVAALRKHLAQYPDHKENYTVGIMRNEYQRQKVTGDKSTRIRVDEPKQRGGLTTSDERRAALRGAINRG
jgi:hypothetical protein